MEVLKKHEASFENPCECLISDIMGSLSIGAPTVSHHLKELSNAELIITERRGKHVVASINEKTVRELASVLEIRKS